MLHDIGIDIGGTKIAAGIVDSGGNIIYQNRMLTPKAGRSEIIDLLKTIRSMQRTMVYTWGTSKFVQLARSTLRVE
ncbi:hypothetical protein B9K06_14215 [Bacillus sp. OG2]|nr:hypothetical protein B9K06_14215 [Bacillus sp. OG2]